MFSKRFGRVARRAAAVAISFGLVGCSLYEGPPPPRKKDFGQGTLGCMKHFNADLVTFFDGKGTVEGVNRAADCAVNALRAFGDLVQGENRDRFTAKEVRDFLQRYFLDDVIVSDDFLRELMRVKQALVGGKETDFTPADLKEAETLVNTFREIFLKLLPSTPLSLDRVRGGDLVFVEAEAKAIAEVGELLGKRITETDSTYSFEELGRLIDEIMLAFPGAKGDLRGIRDNLRLAGVLKQMLISPEHPRGTVTAAEWRLIFQDGGRWLGNYLKYVNLQGRYSDWTRGAGRARLSVVIGESLDLLNRVVGRHCPTVQLAFDGSCRVAPGIPFTLIQEAMTNLDWEGTIAGIDFKKTTLELILPPLVQHFFGGTDLTPTGRAADRLTAEHIARLRALIQDWIDGSRYVEGLFAKVTREPNFPENAMIPTEAIACADVRDILRANGGVNEAAVRTGDELCDAFRRTMALSDRDSAGAIFDGKNATRGRVYRELVRYTWLRPLLKAAVLGYVTGPNILTREKRVDVDGLTLKEFEGMIRDYWQVLLDFKLVANGYNTPEGDAKKRFREASLFTQVSDGNTLISVDEGVQLVLYMLSAQPLGGRLHERAQQRCKNGPLDPYDEPTIEPECYRSHFLNFGSANRDAMDLYSSFPLLLRFYETLKPEDQSEFRRYIELAVRKSGYQPETYFGSDDSDAIPMMFTYLEALFLQYDTGKGGELGADGWITKVEAHEAFPVFKRTLAELSEMDPSDPKILSVFYYLLAKGNPPVDDSMGAWRKFWHSAEFLWWHWTKPDFKADRLSLVQVFATLANSAPPPPKPAPAPSGAPGH